MSDDILTDYADRRAGQFNRTYPTTWRPQIGSEFVGVFVRLDQGPENEYGTPWIVVFTGTAGSGSIAPPGLNTDGESMVDGEEYGFWLIHGVALDQFKAARPEVGERFACLYEGKKASKTRRDKDGPVQYHAYRVVCPDRDTGPTFQADWDTIDAGPVPGEERAPF